MLVLGLAALLPAIAATEARPALTIVPGEVVEFSAPLSPALRKLAGEGVESEFTEALAAVAVPKDFTPNRTWPILVVSATSDPGYNSSRRNLRWFAAAALKAGWVVIAADPVHPVPAADDSNGLRYALILGALARLREQWPELPRWPRAFAGISGGAKRSAWLAAVSAVDGYRPLGVFQAGCNQPVMQDALDFYHPPRAQFLATPVFLSSGNDDTIASPGAMRQVADDLNDAGFRHIKMEHFAGGHQVSASHVEKSLRWFLEIATTPKP
jgi:hypothetical protein